MENGGQQEEPHKSKSSKKSRNKSNKQANKQATVLKQLNNQNLYPLQERIGIYVTAVLSVVGLVLITYTGVMAIVSNTDDRTEVAVDVDEVSDMLGDLEDLLESGDNATADSNQNANPDADEEDGDGGTTSGSNTSGGPTGVINDNMVNLWREPDSPDAILALQAGYVVTLIDFEYNAYWAHVEVETDAIDGTSTVRGFIRREFIDVD